MPRILIADDNSNIQRMAALALKDVGIDVVAVNNGEAAVRKIPEVSPDLVLADIFMPVRNGYEVCEFVKHDPKYSNTPVLLLAGAFDPFDEREAQRVRADGILKKPFVPPDPLINAVRALLEKSAGERLMAVTVPLTADASAKSGAGSAATPARPHPSVAIEGDTPEEENTQPMSPVDFTPSPRREDASFFATQTLERPASEEETPEELETTVTASRDPVLGEPAFWTPAQDQSSDSEQEGESIHDFTDHAWRGSGQQAPEPEELEPPMVLDLERRAALASADPNDVDPITSESAVSVPVVSEPVIAEPLVLESVQDSAALEALPSEPLSSVAATPISSIDASIAPISEIEAPAEDTVALTEDTAPLPETFAEPAALEVAPLQGSAVPEPETNLMPASADSSLDSIPEASTDSIPEAPILDQPPVTSVDSVATEPIEPANPVGTDDESPLLELADPLPAAPEFAAHTYADSDPSFQPDVQPKRVDSEGAMDWPPTFVPAVTTAVPEARELAPEPVPTPVLTNVALENEPHEAMAPQNEPPTAEALEDQPQAAEAPVSGSLSPEDREAVIQRVMERMQSQIVDLVNKQILRPLVESLVRQEFDK